jgi:phage tail-like protein
MAELPAAQRTRYPLPSYGFRVTVDGVSIACSEVTGLSIARETVAYRHGLSAWEGEELVRFDPGKYAPITLKKGVVIGATALLDWLNAEADPRPMEISLCDASGVPAVVWHIAKAVPVKLDAPTFAAASGEAAIEALQVMAAGVSLAHVG